MGTGEAYAASVRQSGLSLSHTSSPVILFTAMPEWFALMKTRSPSTMGDVAYQYQMAALAATL